MKRVAFVLVLSCFTISLHAAEAAPQRALAKLGFLVGSWNVEEIHPADGDRPASKGKGILDVRVGPGGNSIISDYRSTEGPMKGEGGHEVIAIGDSDEYRLFWFDSDSPSPLVMSGGWKGHDLVFDYAEEIFDQHVRVQTKISDIVDGSFTLTMVASSDQKPARTVVTLHCRRGQIQN